MEQHNTHRFSSVAPHSAGRIDAGRARPAPGEPHGQRAQRGDLLSALLVVAAALAPAACADHPVSPLPRGDAAATSVAAPPAAGQRADSGSDLQTDAAPVNTNGPTDDAGDLEHDDAAPRDAAEAPAAGRVSLVIHELWNELEPAKDPFDDRPERVDCTRAGVMAETLADERALGVDTGLCNYLTVTQPTLEDVAAGQLIKVRLWHFELTAPAPAEAHAALVIDGQHVLDEKLPIPAAGGLIVKEVRALRAIPAGTPVFFHLHNHGMNSWALVEVSARGG